MTLIQYDKLERYAFADPAGGKKGRQALRKQRARQAIVVIAVDYLFRIFVLYAWAARIKTSDFRDELIKVRDTHRPRYFGIESNAMQELFGDLVIDEAKKQTGTARGFIAVPQPTKIEKDFRIRTTIEPILNDDRLFIPEHLVELRSEMTGFPTARTKDLVDALASAIALIPKRPAQKRRKAEAELLASFLRSQGAPSWYIEERIAATG